MRSALFGMQDGESSQAVDNAAEALPLRIKVRQTLAINVRSQALPACWILKKLVRSSADGVHVVSSSSEGTAVTECDGIWHM